MTEIITVPCLAIHAVVGEAERDPWGQGFSATWAELTTTDASLIALLSDAMHERCTVTLRCGRLDATGLISKVEPTKVETRLVLAVDDLRLRKTRKTPAVRYRKPKLRLEP